MASEKYHQYLLSEEWDQKRQATLDRDDWKCTRCGAKYPGAFLEVHHLTYARIYKEHLSDLATLCEDCHDEETFSR